MSVVVTLNGIPYQIPTPGDSGWGQEVTNYLVALGSGGVLSLDGGNFPLINELNFGPTYGVASPYFRSGQDPAATTGVVRLTNNEGIYWRNSNNTSDLGLTVQGDALYFGGLPVTGSPLTTKGDIYVFGSTQTRLPVGVNGTVLVSNSSTSTGLEWQSIPGVSGSVTGFTFTNANGISGAVTNPTTTPDLTLSLGAITPTSVTASGTISASNFSGTFSGTSSGTNTGDQTITLTGDVTGSGTGSFATTYNGVVPINKGGTGQTTANNAINALLPSQAGNAGEVLITDGTNVSWAAFPGAGSVTSVSVTANNGITQSVTNPTTTPNITLGLGAITPTSVAASGTVTGSNISGTVSGTNTGDQTITLTGDVTGSGTGTFAATLSNTTVVAGSYTRANITVDNKGRITAAASEPAQVITLTGDVTGSGTGTFATSLSNTGVSAGTYTNANITVDSKGRILSASTGGGGTALSSITPAVAANNINNGTFAQNWQWDCPTDGLSVRNLSTAGGSTALSVSGRVNGLQASGGVGSGTTSSVNALSDNANISCQTPGSNIYSFVSSSSSAVGGGSATVNIDARPFAVVPGSNIRSYIQCQGSATSSNGFIIISSSLNGAGPASSSITLDPTQSKIEIQGFLDLSGQNVGKATLSSGTVTVSNTFVTSNSVIQLTRQGSSSSYGHLYISAVINNTSFTIMSTDSGDNGVIGWTILNN